MILGTDQPGVNERAEGRGLKRSDRSHVHQQHAAKGIQEEV